MQDVNNSYNKRKAGIARPISREGNERGQEATGIGSSKCLGPRQWGETEKNEKYHAFDLWKKHLSIPILSFSAVSILAHCNKWNIKEEYKQDISNWPPDSFTSIVPRVIG